MLSFPLCSPFTSKRIKVFRMSLNSCLVRKLFVGKILTFHGHTSVVLHLFDGRFLEDACFCYFNLLPLLLLLSLPPASLFITDETILQLSTMHTLLFSLIERLKEVLNDNRYQHFLLFFSLFIHFQLFSHFPPSFI